MKLILISLLFITNIFAADTTIYGKLTVSSTTKGSKPCPVMTEAQRDAIASPASGDCVYNSTTLSLNAYNGSAWKSAGGGVNQWLTSTSYQVNDVVIQSNKFYICLIAHTSGTFATDLAAAKWQLIQASIKAKAQNSSSVTLEEIQFPNDSLTETASGKYLASTGNNNILANPSFEHSTPSTSWTLSAGSSAAETTVKIHGEQSLKVTLSAQTLSLYQDSTRYAAQFADGVQGVASVRIKTSVSGLSVCPRLAGTTQTSPCATVNSDNKWMLYKVPFVFGGTSNGIAIVSSGNVTGDVYIDDAYVGTDAGIADVSVVTPWTACAITGSWVSNTTYTCKFRQSGGDAEFNVKVATSGAPTSANLTLTLPFGWAIDTGKINTSTDGLYMFPSDGVVSDSGSRTGSAKVIYKDANTVYIAHILTGASTGAPISSTTVTQAAPFTFGSGDFVEVTFKAPIANLAGSTQVFASQCGSSCENKLTTQVSTAPALSKTTPSGWASSVAKSGTNNQVKTVTAPSGTFSTMPVCECNVINGATAADQDCKWSESASTVTSLVFHTSSNGVASDLDISVECTKAPADYQASRTIVGSFKVPEDEVYVSGGNGHGSTNTRIRRFTTQVSTAGTCAVYADSATLGGSFTIGAGACGGNYALTYCDGASSAGVHFGISKNSSQLTTNVESMTEANRIVKNMMHTASVNYQDCVTVTTYLSSGDVIRAHTDSLPSSTTAGLVNFRIKKVSL